MPVSADYYCRFLDSYNVDNPETDQEWGGYRLTNYPDKMMAYITHLLTTYTKAEIVYSSRATTIVFKYRPDANHPYIYFTVYTASNCIRIGMIGFTYDETNNAYQTYFITTGGYKQFNSSYPAAFFIAFPGYFCIADAANGNVINSSGTSNYLGCGFMYYPTDHRNPSVTPGVVTTGSGGVLSNVPIVFDRDMSNLVAGDYVHFWPVGTGPFIRGLVASVSGSIVTFTSLSADVVSGQVGLLFPILVHIDGNTNFNSRLLTSYGASGAITYSSFPSVNGCVVGDGPYRSAADPAGRYPLIRLRFYLAAYGSCQIPTTGFGFFYKSNTAANAAVSNNDGSVPQSYVSTASDVFSLTGAWSFTEGALVGKYIFFLDGNCISQVRKITANTATTISWQHPTLNVATAISNFVICDEAFVINSNSNLMSPFNISYFCMKEQY